MSFYGKKHIGIFVLFILFLSTVFTGCNGEKKSEFYDNSGNSINGGIASNKGVPAITAADKKSFKSISISSLFFLYGNNFVSDEKLGS
jgi:hypothetical protein